jgi:hypothetical protein
LRHRLPSASQKAVRKRGAEGAGVPPAGQPELCGMRRCRQCCEHLFLPSPERGRPKAARAEGFKKSERTAGLALTGRKSHGVQSGQPAGQHASQERKEEQGENEHMSNRIPLNDQAPRASRHYIIQYGFKRSGVFSRWWSAFIRIRALTISIDWHPYRKPLKRN